ncbi:hypothetical protein N7447_008787, partial [Penicillium robsamsonii]|uniref:uncharacterized protein n=1 Tax=Penicillium robsamsonii TaxID=1792511 RepID=UPI0025486692
MVNNENEKMSEDPDDGKAHALALSHRYVYRDKAEYQLVKKVAEIKIGEGARVLRDELYLIKVDSANRAAVLDEKDEIRARAIAAF